MNTNSSSLADSYKISHYGFAELYHNSLTNQRSMYASVSFKQGDIISDFKAAAILKTASKYTVQISGDEHIILHPEHLQYINHSCSPNTFFDTELLQVVALKEIEPGDELTFFYPSTEWDMAEQFGCQCGCSNCLQQIQGAKYLSPNIIEQYKLTSFIHSKYFGRQL